MMAGHRPLPKDTAVVLDTTKEKALVNCHNLGLLLDRFNPWRSVEGKWDLSGEAKRQWLSSQQQGHIDAALLNAHRTRWQQLVAHYGADEGSGLCFKLRTESRLVVGLGTDSVLETAITLHRIYGFPIIPGSALKGLTRVQALLTLAADLGVPALSPFDLWKLQDQQPTPLNKLESLLESDLEIEDEKEQESLHKALDMLKREQTVKDAGGDIRGMSLAQFKCHEGVRDFRAVFGYPRRAGGAVFFNAVPAGVPRLTVDVMNVHYPDYYQDERGKTAPSDDQNPIPVPFLTVTEGAIFQFAVGGRRPANSDDLDCTREARRWLEQALREIGVGAKTGAGYGYFGERRPVKLGRAKREPPVPRPSPTRSGQVRKAVAGEQLEKREQERKALIDIVMRRLYGDEE